MTHDELAELMSEPPGGHNHGRKRGEGGWVSLETFGFDEGDLEYVVNDPLFRRRTRYDSHAPHGTRSRYVNGRCRCEDCRRANREYIRQLRHGCDIAKE